MSKTKDITTVKTVLAFLIIAVLFIPLIAGYVTSNAKLHVILTTDETNFISVGHANSDEVNHTLTDIMFPTATNRYGESNNDTVLHDYAGLNTNNFTNDVVTVGDLNTATVNYSHLSGIDFIFHQLDWTTYQFADCDFITVETNAKHGRVWLAFAIDVLGYHDLEFDQTLANKSMMVVDSYVWTAIRTQDDTNAFLLYSVLDTDDTNYWFNITGYQLSSSVWGWSEENLYGLSMAFSICILGIAIFFATDMFDIKHDKNRKDSQ